LDQGQVEGDRNPVALHQRNRIFGPGKGAMLTGQFQTDTPIILWRPVFLSSNNRGANIIVKAVITVFVEVKDIEDKQSGECGVGPGNPQRTQLPVLDEQEPRSGVHEHTWTFPSSIDQTKRQKNRAKDNPEQTTTKQRMHVPDLAQLSGSQTFRKG
jgi:hypothetical protein